MPTEECYTLRGGGGGSDREEAIYDLRLHNLEEVVRRSNQLVDELIEVLVFESGGDEKSPTPEAGPCITVDDSILRFTEMIQKSNDRLAQMVGRAQKYFCHKKAF